MPDLHSQCILLVILSAVSLCCGQVPATSTTWVEMKPESSIWTARNAHASCVFNGKMYVVGGHTDLYPTYDLQLNDKTADVWWSEDGLSWTRNLLLEGDFFAQNHDVVQPGPIAPFYPRYGHSLDPFDIDKNGGDDIMILLGGFAPNTINDVWVTEDSNKWFYVGEAPWSPRAWHSTVTYNKTLYLMGGTPLNSEIWVITDVRKKTDRPAPLTRAMYMDYTYAIEWAKLEAAPWSPRAGMGVVNQPYTGTLAAQTERIVMVGGYGGWLSTDDRFDGIRCQSDVWATFDMQNWTRIAATTDVGGVAWFGFSVWSSDTTDADHTMWIVGGGYIGDVGNKKVGTMQGSVNSYYSKDGITWTRTNYKLGGGTSPLEQYSSNEWTTSVIDGNLMFLGLWGLTLETFQVWGETDSSLYILGGDQDGEGTLKDVVFRGGNGLLCDVNGIVCGGVGKCSDVAGEGCLCDGTGFSGVYCDQEGQGVESAAPRVASRLQTISMLTLGVSLCVLLA